MLTNRLHGVASPTGEELRLRGLQAGIRRSALRLRKQAHGGLAMKASERGFASAVNVG